MADHIGKINEICSVTSEMLAEISLNSFSTVFTLFYHYKKV